MGRHAKGVNQLTFLTVAGDSLVYLLQSLFVVSVGKYEEGLGDFWAVKGGDTGQQDPNTGEYDPLHFALNASFRRTGQTEFEAHVTALSYVHLQYLDNITHQVATEENYGLVVVRSRGLAFMGGCHPGSIGDQPGRRCRPHFRSHVLCVRTSCALSLLRT